MKNGIVVIGTVFLDIKGYPIAKYIPGGRNAGRVVRVHGGVSRNVAEDIANVELRPTFVTVVDDDGAGRDVVEKLKRYIQKVFVINPQVEFNEHPVTAIKGVPFDLQTLVVKGR